MDPQQELFTELLLQLKEKGYSVYDGALPPKNTPYPFIYLADSQLIDDIKKHVVIGDVYQTVNVWHNSPKERGTVSKMLLDIKSVARHIERTQNFGWMIIKINQQVMPDNTTKQPLVHGIIDLHYRFS
jgi:hypothetical protein